MNFHKNIVIVEDNPIVAMELEEELYDSGFKLVDCVATVRQANDLITKKRPSVVILDMHLKSETTFDFALILKRDAIPFFFLSGSDISSLPQQLKESHLLTKTASTEDIVTLIKSLIDG